jgi:SnoaL-like domain
VGNPAPGALAASACPITSVLPARRQVIVAGSRTWVARQSVQRARRGFAVSVTVPRGAHRPEAGLPVGRNRPAQRGQLRAPLRSWFPAHCGLATTITEEGSVHVDQRCLPDLGPERASSCGATGVPRQWPSAFCSFLYHVGGTLKTGDEVNMWVRATLCCRRIDGRWRIVHDHESVPFDPATGQALISLEPR